jgi:PAS domain S-box-containing protein
MRQETPIKVLLIEDNPDNVSRIERFLDQGKKHIPPFTLSSMDSLKTGLNKLSQEKFDVVILDLSLPDSKDGFETFTKLKSHAPHVPVVVLTNHDNETLGEKSVREGAQDYLVRDAIDGEVISRVVRYAIERKNVEDALKSYQTRYRLLYEYNPSMYFTVDAAGTVLSVNQFGAAELGYAKEELVGQKVTKVFYEEDGKAVEENLKRCLENPNKVFKWEMRKVRKDGNLLWVKETASAVRDNEGNEVILIVCEDISDRKRLDRMKGEFINTIYSEMKAPLENIHEAIDSLKDESLGKFTEKQIKVLDIVERNIFHFMRITDELLDLSRLELGKTKANLHSLDFLLLMENLVQDFKPAARDWKLTLRTEFPKDMPEIEADPILMERVLKGVINRALRFAKEEVLIKAKIVSVEGEAYSKLDSRLGVNILQPSKEYQRFLQVSVIDDGPGIELEGPLQSLDGPAGEALGKIRKPKLDLLICKEILALHHGGMWFHGEPGKGSRFSFMLPLMNSRK